MELLRKCNMTLDGVRSAKKAITNSAKGLNLLLY